MMASRAALRSSLVMGSYSLQLRGRRLKRGLSDSSDQEISDQHISDQEANVSGGFHGFACSGS